MAVGLSTKGFPQLEINGEPAVAPDRGGMTVLRSSTSHQPPRQVNFFVRRRRYTAVEGYCTVRVKWNGGEPDDEQLARHGTFDELVTLLKQVRDRHADEYADALADDPDAARAVDGDVLGGFGVEVTNRWGSVVEVGPGRDVWFLFRHKPPPARCHSDRPTIAGTRVFYLDGGHHTELGADMLVSREECLRALRVWLDSGEFPDKRHAEPGSCI